MLEDSIYPSRVEGIDIIPSTLSLQEANNHLQSNYGDFPQLKLKRILKNLDNKYDCVVIDTAPNLDVIIYNCLAVATYYIIPIKTDTYSLKGLKTLIYKIDEFAMNIDKKM